MEIPQYMQAAYQKALKKGIGIEYFKKLMEHSDFLDKVHKLTHGAAVAAGLIKGSPIVVRDLLGPRKSISVFIMHSDYIKEEFGEDDDIYAKAQFSIALYAGFLCAMKWWENTAEGKEAVYNDCVMSSYSDDKAGTMLCKKYSEEAFEDFLDDIIYILADEIANDKAKNFELNMIHALDALFQLGVTLALYEK